MKTLPTSFRKGGFRFEMDLRMGDVAMFRKSSGDYTGYEVVIIQRHDGREIAGNEIGPAEYMPPSESWGRLGWTFQTEDAAEQKFRQLVEARQ